MRGRWARAILQHEASFLVTLDALLPLARQFPTQNTPTYSKALFLLRTSGALRLSAHHYPTRTLAVRACYTVGNVGFPLGVSRGTELGVEKVVEEAKESKEGDGEGGEEAAPPADAGDAKPAQYTNHAAALLDVIGTLSTPPCPQLSFTCSIVSFNFTFTPFISFVSFVSCMFSLTFYLVYLPHNVIPSFIISLVVVFVFLYRSAPSSPASSLSSP